MRQKGKEVSETDAEFIELTPENIDEEHLCCIIRKGAHTGIETKRAWLRERLAEGHVFRKLVGRECVFIEYAPLETAGRRSWEKTICISTAFGYRARRADTAMGDS